MVLGNIAPLQGPKGTLVTITGKNFGTDASKVTVLVNEKEMPIVSLENTEIQLEVLAATLSGEIEVRFGTESFFPGTFSYEVTATVTTLAGNGEGRADGIGPEAQFDTPRGITLDEQGNLYVADSGNSSI